MKTVLTLFLAFTLSSCGGGSSSDDYLYIALGASDTTGIGASPISSGWAFRLADMIDGERDDFEFENYGLPGAKVGDIENVSLRLALDASDPEVITLFTGPNDIIAGDSPQAFGVTLNKILSELRADSISTLIAVALIPDFTRAPRFISEPDRDVTKSRIDAFNAEIRAAAQANGIFLVDLTSVAVGAEVTADDGFHPNNDGHRIIAEKFFEILRPNLPL